MAGAGFELTSGFWFQTPPSDCDSTGCVDLPDYAGFELCLTEPGAAITIGCECFDVNRSRTVGLAGFLILQATYTGP